MLVLEVSIVAAVLPMAAVTEGARHLTGELVRLLLARVPAGDSKEYKVGGEEDFSLSLEINCFLNPYPAKSSLVWTYLAIVTLALGGGIGGATE